MTILDRETALACPRSESEVWEYVQMESADVEDADPARFRFVRTAAVEGSRYWLWEYTESCGDECYVFVRQDGDRNLTGIMSADGQSPEEFLRAQHDAITQLWGGDTVVSP